MLRGAMYRCMVMGLSLMLVLSSMVISAPEVSAANTTYYVDSVNGNDNLDGKSQTVSGTVGPWKTLVKLSSVTFSPGDKILFKSGCTFSGQFNAQGSGTDGSPIVVDIYGGTAKAIINGNGVDNGAIRLVNLQYWEFNNLEVMNDYTSASDLKCGIRVEGTNRSTLNHIYVQNCYFHDIAGHAGIYIDTPNDSTKAVVYNDIKIHNNRFENTKQRGLKIWNAYYFENTGLTENTPSGLWTNISVKNNTTYNTGRQGLILCGANGGMVEYNTVGNPSQNGTGGGIFIESCRSTTVQYNEAYGNKYNSGDADSHGIGIDKDLFDSICQYNYVHDNDESGLVIFSDGTDKLENCYIRYNISENNGDGDIQTMGPVKNLWIYNNSFYTKSGTTTNMIKTDNWGGYPQSIYWKNNIFFCNSSGGYDLDGTHYFDYNTYYPNHPTSEPSDSHKLTSAPGAVESGVAGTGMNTVNGYKLKVGSASIRSGTLISNNGGKDFWGNAVSSTAAPNRGPYNGKGVVVVANRGFESGDFTSWTTSGTVAVDSTNQLNGSYCAKLGSSSADGSITQTITGLTANTTYKLRVYMKAGSGKMFAKVINYGGLEVNNYTTNTSSIDEVEVSFTTGASNTSATIIIQDGVNTAGSWGYVDEIELEKQ